MFGLLQLMGLLILSHTVYDVMKEDREKWVSSIRKYVARKWHQVEQRVASGGNGKKEGV